MIKQLAIIAALFSALAAGAQTVQPILQPYQTFQDGSGAPCSGCSLYSYAAGTTTPLATYTDSTGGTPNTNPIILDAAGGAQVWLGVSSYKFILKDTIGQTIRTVDNVNPVATIAGLTAYLPLTGGTLSGAFNGTSAALSGAVSAGTTLTVGTTLTSPVVNNTYFPVNLTQFQADVTACASAACTITISSTIAVTANTALAATVGLTFANGAQLQPDLGHTLTINGPIQAGPVQIFGGAGTVVLGAITSKAPVEWFGAVGDWNGSAGTDNKVTLQACLNALTNGQCMLLQKAYKVTGALTIGKSNVGIGGVTASLRNDSLFPNPSPSQIVTTSSTADVITAAGTNSTTQIVGNRFTNFTMSRTVAPGTTAAGIRLSYSSNAIIDYVTGQDHTACFYFFGSGSLGFGYVSNSACTWGYNGVTETSGQLAGFEINSIGGTPSPSMRLRNTFEASNLGTSSPATTYGIEVDGTSVNDFHSFHNESAQTNYGIYVTQTGGSFGNSSDIFISEPINDGCLTSCLYFSGIQGSVVVNGGWDYENAAASNGPDIDIESSSNVTISNNQLYYPATGQPGIHANTAGSLHIEDNWIFGNHTAVDFVTTSSSVISGNIMNGPNAWGTNVISLTSGSKGNAVANNSIQGTATNGIFIDTDSISVSGLDTNQIGSIPSLGTITNFVNDANQLGAATPESLVVGNVNIPGSGGVQFPLLAGGGPECLHMDSVGQVTGTGSDCGAGGGGVLTINGTAGAFTFTGSGVSCTTTTCTFSGTGGGAITATSVTVSGFIATNAEFSNGTCTTAKTIDPANGNRQKVTLTDTDVCALTFTQPAVGTATVQIKVTQSAAGAFSGGVSGCKWPGGAVPTITQTSGAVDMVSAYLDGTNAYCQIAQAFN